MSGPDFPGKPPARRTRSQKEIERLSKVNDLLRREAARLQEELTGKPCEVVVVGETIDYQLVLPLDAQEPSTPNSSAESVPPDVVPLRRVRRN